MARFCKNKKCRKKFKPRFNTTEVVCSTACAIEFARSSSGKSYLKKEKTRDANRARKELRRSTLSWQLERTQIAFNKMRVLEELLWHYERGLEPVCISCAKPNMDFCCGHYETVGSSGVLRFNRVNTYLQCNKYCNSSLSANKSGNAHTRGYTQGLIDRFGENVGNAILHYLETNKAKIADWDCEKIEAMRKAFNARIRELTPKVESYRCAA